jgi:hypothetical protein
MMNDKKKRFPLFVFANLVLVIFLGAASSGQSLAAGPLLGTEPSGESMLAAETEKTEATVEPIELRLPPRTAAAPTPPSNPWTNYPNVCETFNVIQSTERVRGKDKKWHYPVRYKRNRYKRAYKERRRTRKLVEFVAEEMGVAHPEFFAAFAMHESTWNPEAIHILNPDLDSNQRAWERHTYDAAKEKELEEKLTKLDAREKPYWAVKARLADIRLYKGNTHWNDRLAYSYIIPEHTVKLEGVDTVVPKQVMGQSQGVWGFGYGLYGMYAVGYVKLWDREAPPWILCGDEGIIATVIQVWAARNNTTECDSLTTKNPEKWGHSGGTYEGVLRRLARGHCSDKRLGKVWQRLMKEYATVPWDQHADFGLEKWPQYEMKKKRGKWVYKRDAEGKKIPTDREALLAHMLAKAEKKGLLRSAPLELHRPDSAPVVVASRSVEVGTGGSSASQSAAP